MSEFGPIHTLKVTEVGESYGAHSTEDFTEYEIDHTADCAYALITENGIDGAKVEPYRVYTCGVGYNVDACGARFSLYYSGTPINEPGEYKIRAWAATTRGFDYVEYDGGIVLVAEAP